MTFTKKELLLIRSLVSDFFPRSKPEDKYFLVKLERKIITMYIRQIAIDTIVEHLDISKTLAQRLTDSFKNADDITR